jgi:hypothetical protein
MAISYCNTAVTLRAMRTHFVIPAQAGIQLFHLIGFWRQSAPLDSRLRGITSDLASVVCSLSRLASRFINDG